MKYGFKGQSVKHINVLKFYAANNGTGNYCYPNKLNEDLLDTV
jgi:hypothetical protein